MKTTVAVKSENTKCGTSARGPWTKWSIQDADGNWYSTFDKDLWLLVKSLTGKPFELEYESLPGFSSPFLTMVSANGRKNLGSGTAQKITILGVKEFTGTSKRGPWTRWSFRGSDGHFYGTFDEAQAQNLMQRMDGEAITIRWSDSGKGRSILEAI